MLHPDCRRVSFHLCMKNATTDLVSRCRAMAKPNINQSQEQTSVAESAATLRAERQTSMANSAAEAALRASEANTQQISPSSTPSRTNITSSGEPQLSEAVREQWNVPQEETAKPKANLQDVKTIGDSLKSQGVTTNEVSQGNSKAQIENSFDNAQGSGSTYTQGKSLSETDKITAQARQSVQKESESQSLGWER